MFDSFNRKFLVSLAIITVIACFSLVKCFAKPPAPAAGGDEVEKHDEIGEKPHHDNDKDDDRDDDEREEHRHKGPKKEEEIEQVVPMAFIPQAVLDAVKKEVPEGNITEAELEAKKHRIMYSFDVTAGDMKYEVKITVDAKFYSKKVDDDADEKEEKDQKAEHADKH